VRRQNPVQFFDHNQELFVVVFGRNLRTQLVNAITLVFVHKELAQEPGSITASISSRMFVVERYGIDRIWSSQRWAGSHASGDEFQLEVEARRSGSEGRAAASFRIRAV
jgi:hypothetical protein